MKRFLSSFIFIFILFYYSNLYAANIATINTEYIYKNSNAYNLFLSKTNNFKEKNKKIFKKEEDDLIIKKKDLKDIKDIASQDEITLLTDEYNILLQNLLNKVDEVNTIISDNIKNNEILFKKIIIAVSQEIAINDNIDIILSENQYFISSKSVDISAQIVEIINNKDIEFIFTDK